ncbi:nicotinamide riboside transporter PnuC [Neokomagataea thailandica]|uniref:Nicotinamide riboside transporter PnuC n=1 Tax=Neokomagataea tanensis NBRC 106556 TaxID=1223519 RepID=A0ABQ0QJT6_9PROT|nr:MULTISPECIES: nicotinamide riboside transporter PnuC [Neokomagataea]GBR47314.1 nicotinamide mononucleotide transporter [Neokomagataea tanensis NBRC 106556]
MSWLELLGVIANVLGVWFTVRRSMWCWPIGLVGVFVYFYQFLLWKLYSDMGLQIFYAVMLFYGWWAWARAGQKDAEDGLMVQPAQRGRFALEGVVTLLLSFILGYGLRFYTDDPMPWGDAGLTCFSLLASLWAARRHWENWALWIVVDTLYAVAFFWRHDLLTAGLYVMFTVLAAYGMRDWRREVKAADGAKV